MRVQNYENFLGRLRHASRKTKRPLRVVFELTYRCNFRCRHCYIPFSYRKKPELRTKEIFSILDQLAQAGCLYLGFTGGEPFMRKDLMEILAYAKKNGFLIILNTNGSLIDKKKAKALAGLGLNKVDITIPAMSERVFERITRLNGSYKEVFRAVGYLRGFKVPLGFKTCVLKENQDQIEGIRGFCRAMGVVHRLDDMLMRRVDGSAQPYRYRGFSNGFFARKKAICGEIKA